jgi:hypothetical protein
VFLLPDWFAKSQNLSRYSRALQPVFLRVHMNESNPEVNMTETSLRVLSIIGRYRFMRSAKEFYLREEIYSQVLNSYYSLGGNGERKYHTYYHVDINYYLLVGIVFPTMSAYVLQDEKMRLIQLCEFLNDQYDQWKQNLPTVITIFDSAPWEPDFLRILDNHLESITPFLSNEFLKMLKSLSTYWETAHWKDLLDSIQYNWNAAFGGLRKSSNRQNPNLEPYRPVKSTVDPSCVTYLTVPTLGTKYRSETLEPPVLVVTLERMRNALKRPPGVVTPSDPRTREVSATVPSELLLELLQRIPEASGAAG